jgi:hypothetical protein
MSLAIKTDIESFDHLGKPPRRNIVRSGLKNSENVSSDKPASLS